MAKVFVFCDHTQGELKTSTRELLSAAEKSPFDLVTGALGPASGSLTAEVSKYGSQKHYFSESEAVSGYNPVVFAEAVGQMLSTAQAEVILASSSLTNRDLFPRVAAKQQSGIASDCTGLDLTKSPIAVHKPLYAGKCFAEVEFGPDGPAIVLMRANQLPVAEGQSSGNAESAEVTIPPQDLTATLKEVVKGASEKLDLTEAGIIVSGGRGLKGPENFKILEELADVLGATVGASRAVVDAGWVPHSMQVGQTGKTVAPNLYIACGISGAVQHLAGMSGSRVIVAINSDPEAPIFQKATYGIVGDVFEVVPKLTEAFRSALN